MTTTSLRIVLALTLPIALGACTSGTTGEPSDDSSDTTPATKKGSKRSTKKAPAADAPEASNEPSGNGDDDDVAEPPKAKTELASGDACDNDGECASGRCARNVCAFMLGESCPSADAPCTGKIPSDRVACAHVGSFAETTFQCMKAGDYQGVGKCSACFSEIDCPTVAAGTVHACKENTCVSAKGSAPFRCY